MKKLNAYVRLTAKSMNDAESLLKKKDASQAREKLWGAVAEVVKATAARHGKSGVRILLEVAGVSFPWTRS